MYNCSVRYIWYVAAALLCMHAACTPVLRLDPGAQRVASGSTELIVGISAVDASTVWISGTGGMYGRTLDGGETWESGVVPGADSLQFRDIHAVDAQTAYLLSIGFGSQSRIYKTADGGRSWVLQFTNQEPEGFFDCMGFWDAERGLAFSDSFDGAFYIVTTNDGGSSWTRIPTSNFPAASSGEGSFAASGHCVHVFGDSTAWIGTGAGENANARVLITTDGGSHWTDAATPIAAGGSKGIASVTFHDRLLGAALGGDVADMESTAPNVALTYDGGLTWSVIGRPYFSGPVYGATYVSRAPVPTLVAAGPNGIAFTADQGTSWTMLSDLNHWSVAFADATHGWAVGPDGRITKLQLYE